MIKHDIHSLWIIQAQHTNLILMSTERRTAKLLVVLTLLGALVTGVLQRQADGTIVARAVFPVGDDLSGRCTMSHCRGDGSTETPEV